MAKFFILVVFLFCVLQNAHSQLLNPHDKKGEYLPPYNPSVSRISPDVEKWMNEQIADKAESKRMVKMKTDILGRVKSSQDRIGDEKIFVVEDKQKRLVIISDIHIQKHEIEPEHGRYEYNTETQKYDHFLNGKKKNEKEYLEYLDKSLVKFKQQKRGKRDLPIPGVIAADARSWMAWMTAGEISELVKNYKELVIEDYTELKPLASQASILSSIQLSTHAFPNGYGGNGIGVYVIESKCAILSGITNPSRYTAANTCSKSNVSKDNAHHTMVANIVQMSSPLAHVFGFGRTPLGGGIIYGPDDPFSYSPPLEIGSHSYSNENVDQYGYSNMIMDNYIYEYGVINFIAAGNGAEYGEVVTSPGKAMNAITVGALIPMLAPKYASYASYSSWKNPVLINRNGNSEQRMGSDKPEIAMYTDIEFPNNSVMQTYYPSHTNGFNGTSAATPLAAGFTATILSQHPFFKRQPALMKAVLLTGETTLILAASSWDLDNGSNDYPGYNAPVAARRITNYSSVAWGTRSAWWNGGNSAFFDSNNEIKFTENDIQANKRYRIAIAYLVEGNYIYDNGKLPQDIDLHVEQNGQTIAYSQSGRNPFEVVDFVTTSNAPLTIRIYRCSNSGSGDVLLGYHMRENF